MDGHKENNVALAHPYHVGKGYSKFGRIPSSGFGGDSMMDRCKDGRKDAWSDELMGCILLCLCVSKIMNKVPLRVQN